MATGWIEQLTGSFEQKRRYKHYKARIKELPGNYRTAAEAVDRYLMHTGGVTNGEMLIEMLEDLADLFEQSAAAGTPVRDVVGDEPAEFVDDFVRNYSDGGWAAKERKRLAASIDRAADEAAHGTGPSGADTDTGTHTDDANGVEDPGREQ